MKATALSLVVMGVDSAGIGKMVNQTDSVVRLGQMASILESTKTTRDQDWERTFGRTETSTSANSLKT